MINFISTTCRSLSHLRVSLRISPNNALFSCSLSSSSTVNSLSDSSDENSFTVNYLISSRMLPPESALSASKYLNFKTQERPDSVLALLKNHGFTNTQISSMVRKSPRILLCDPEKTLLPKLEFFTSVGLSSTDLAEIVTLSLNIFHRSLENFLLPCFRCFKDLVQSDDKVITVIKRHPTFFGIDLQTMLPNIQILRQVGVPKSNIRAIFLRHPRVLFHTTDKFRRTVDKVKELGFKPSQMKFLMAILVLLSLSKSTWEKKVEFYKKWGWSEVEFFVAFRKYPNCMMTSEEKIHKIMDFFVNKMGLESSVLAKTPLILSRSLVKRIIPRCLIYQVLLDRGLMEKRKDFGFEAWLGASDSKFINRIRKSYEMEAPELLKLYQKNLDLTK